VRVTDTLPANVTYLSGPSGSAGASYNAGLNAILFNGTVPANGQVSISYSVRVNTPLDHGTVIANNATIQDSFNRFDTSPPATTVIQSAPDLSTSSKSVNLTTAAPGDTLEYTVVLTNTGNMNAVIGAGNPLLDEIPANTTFNGGLFASAGSIGYNAGFNRVEWYGAVPAGGSVTLRYRVRVATPLDNGTLITNVATINEGAGFPTPQTYQRTATTTIVSEPNLVGQSAKLVDRAVAAPGDILAYTILLRNTGNMNAPNVTLTDTLPANVTWSGDAFLSATGGVVQFFPVTRTVVWNGDMNAGATVQILFRANANSPLPNNTQIVNTARVSDAAGNFAPFSVQALTTIQSSPNLNASTKTVNAATATPGTILTYTLTLNNSGNAVANAVLTDTLPPELQNPVLISVSSGAAQVVGPSQVRWSGQVTPTQNVVITFRATLLPVLDNGTQVANTALVDDGVNPAFFLPPAVTTIQSSPNLNTSIKTVDRATAAPNDILVYTIALTNTGNMVARAQVRDVLPPNVTFNGGLSASPGAPLPTYSSINNRVSWQGDVTPGAPITVTYRVRINTPLDNGTLIQNNAEIGDGLRPPFDTDPPAETVVVSAPDLSTSTKSVDLATAAPGDLLRYTIRLVNTGDMIATGVALSDTLPVEVTFASGPFVTGGGSSAWNPAQRRVVWNGSVTPGSDVVVEYYVTVNSPLPNGTAIVNDAAISGSFGSFTTNAVTTIVASDHALTLGKSAPSAVGAGQVLTYTLSWSVTGDEPATGIVITDAVPANTTYVSCAGAPCSQSGGVVTWNLGNRVPGNSGSVSFVVTVSNLLPNGTQINNTGYIADADGASAQGSAVTIVTSGHGFSLDKRDTGYDPVAAGGTLVYTLDWSMAGTEAAQGVIITDALPVNTAFQSCGPAPCNLASGIVNWNLGNQNPGASGTVTMAVTVASPLPNGTLLTNVARISDGNGGLPTGDTEQTTVQSSHALNIEKNGPVTTTSGGQIAYTIAYTVTGNETAQNLIIEDTTPPNTTFASASGAPTIDTPGVGNTGVVRWRLGNVAPGTSGTVTLVVNVNAPLPNGTVINNTATITDGNGGTSDVDSTSTTVTSGHGFTLTKTDTPDPVTPNGFINYTLNWQVTGNEPAQSVVITDALPANTTFSNCGACVLQGGVVRWDLGNRNPGDSGDVFVQVRVNTPLPNGTLINNTARISDGNGGTPATAGSSTTVQSDHQLTLSKSAPSIVAAGQPLTYTLNWSVTGDEPAPGVVITDAIPANTTFGSCTGGCSVLGGVVTWNLGDRVPGNSGSVTLIVAVGNLLPNGTLINNTARIFDADGASAQSSATTTVSSGHGFTLDKRDTGYDPVQAGGTLVYSIDWSTAGTEAAQNVVITDALPANTAFQSCAPAPCSQVGGVVTWNLGNRNPNVSGTVTVAVTVASPLPNLTLLTNAARISDGNGGLPTTDSEQTTVQSSHALNVTKTAPATVAAGGQIVYSIAWSVSGNETAQNVVIEDVTPPNTTFASAAGAATIDAPAVGSVGLVRWRLGNRPPGSSGAVTLVVNVNTPLPNGTLVNNTATIADGNGGATDTDSASTTVTSSHGFTLTKTDTPDPVTPGGILNYTVNWQVTGNEPAQNVVVTDAIPANTAFWSCGGCVLQSGVVRWNLGTRNPGDGGDLTLQVLVNTPLPDGTLITNVARISDGNNGAPLAATATTTVQSGHSLVINKSAPSAVGAGSLIAYSIDYAVSGSEVAPGVVITDALPSGTSYLAGSCQPALACSEAGGIVTWNLGDLLPGSAGTVQFSARADSGLPNGTQVVNTAYIADNDGEAASDSATTRVGSEVSLSLSDERTTVQPGERITYTVRFSGTEPLNNGRIQIDLPANTTFVAAGAGYLNAGDAVFWLLAPQPPGFSGERQLVVQVDPVLDNGTLISTTAYLSGDGQSTDVPAEATVVSAPNWSTALKTADRFSVEPTARLTYTLYLSNTGNMHAGLATLQDPLPPDVTYVNGSLSASSGAAGYDSSTNRVLWDGSVPVGSGVQIVFAVTVNAGVLPGTPIVNSASLADEVNAPTLLSVEVNTVAQEPRVYAIYLPIVTRSFGGPQLPDLTITDFKVIPNPMTAGVPGWDVEITVKNVGNAPLPNGVWMDLYIDPVRAPEPNVPFYAISPGPFGGVWWLPQLNPGESVVLSKNDILPDWLPFFPDSLDTPGDHTLYAQIDSLDERTANPPAWARVYELNENNNVYGPVTVRVNGVGGASAHASRALPDLPQRWPPR
jgi:uncharacterized repeat protein (TIGR01451 family)